MASRRARRETVLWNTREGGLLGTLQGQWSSVIARYLNTVNPYAGFTLAELLWNVGGHRNSARVEDEALRLLRAMGLVDTTPFSARR